jgi:DDE superfamily endonuclease
LFCGGSRPNLAHAADCADGIFAGRTSALGKTANCQTLVSLMLARGEVPVMLALRLFLREGWTRKQARLERAGVPT